MHVNVGVVVAGAAVVDAAAVVAALVDAEDVMAAGVETVTEGPTQPDCSKK
jgi:hypothetical protein